MKLLNVGFEQILHSTLRMTRRSLDTDLCVFLQFDDQNQLCVRAADGAGAKKWLGKAFPVTAGEVQQCVKDNRVIRVHKASADSMLALLERKDSKKTTYILVPVAGQSRILGVFICGPFRAAAAKAFPKTSSRSTGALCAVLTAHWRLYEWLSSFTPQVNHELRTPLTAVQGSIGMVLGGMCGQVDGEMRDMLEMAQKGCERTVRAIEEYITKQLPDKNSEFNAGPDALRHPKKKTTTKISGVSVRY